MFGTKPHPTRIRLNYVWDPEPRTEHLQRGGGRTLLLVLPPQHGVHTLQPAAGATRRGRACSGGVRALCAQRLKVGTSVWHDERRAHRGECWLGEGRREDLGLRLTCELENALEWAGVGVSGPAKSGREGGAGGERLDEGGVENEAATSRRERVRCVRW